MTHSQQIAKSINVSPSQVTAVIQLLDDGNTMPFIARYRKEATGSLDEDQIREIDEQINKLRTLDERRDTIVAAIEAQEKMTPELNKQLLAASTMTELEDLYQPYKQKRRTRATMAREKGLEPLAELILAQLISKQTPHQIAHPFINDDVPTSEEALEGARDIVAEVISDNATVRQTLRDKALQWGILQSKKIKKAEDQKEVYQLYYDYQQRVDRVRPHQILAMNRGEQEKILRVGIEISERDWILAVRTQFRPDRMIAVRRTVAISDGRCRQTSAHASH